MSDFALVIVSNVAVASCVAVGATLVGLRNRFCATAHVLWLVVFVKLIAPPIIPLPLPLPAQWYDCFVTQEVNNSAVISTKTELNKSLPPLKVFGLQRLEKIALPQAEPGFLKHVLLLLSIYWLQAVGWGLFSVWITVALFLLCRGANRFFRFARLLRHQAIADRPASEEAQSLYEMIRNRSGTGQLGSSFPARRIPQVVVVPSDMAPMLFAIGNWIAIVCPERLWIQFGVERRRAFIAHELAHFLRRDHWVRWLEWLVSSIYWWLPLTYVAKSQLERNEELACDEWAINRFSINKRDYAETLLQVVEFLDETRLRSQRLASRMQPTDLLEQRICWVLSTGRSVSRLSCWSCLAIGLALGTLLLHPSPYRWNLVTIRLAPPSQMSLADATVGLSSGNASEQVAADDWRLPAAPLGWWNRLPKDRWAEVVFKSTGVRLIADSSQGLRLLLADGRSHTFRPAEDSASRTVKVPSQSPVGRNPLTACVEIPEARRLVLADSEGALRLWDLSDLAPVSLIGIHSASVTSIAFHDQAGLVAADSLGSVIRWDYNSGSAVSTWTSQQGPIQSIRWSRSGEHLGVLLGNWSHDARRRQLVLLDAINFSAVKVVDLPAETAVVWDDAHFGWVYTSWLGQIRLLSGQPVTSIAKSAVSAFVLTQDAISPITAAFAQGEHHY